MLGRGEVIGTVQQRKNRPKNRCCRSYRIPAYVLSMFSKLPDVTYFGHWADAAQSGEFRRAAMDILCRAADRCWDEDMRERSDVQAALDYLAANITRPALVTRFRKALDETDPASRRAAAVAAYNALVRALSYP